MRYVILVTLCCATYVGLRCSTNHLSGRFVWTRGSCLARALGVTKFVSTKYIILVTLCCATYVGLRCSTNHLRVLKTSAYARCLLWWRRRNKSLYFSNLIYYDELGRQDEPIFINVETSNVEHFSSKTDGGIVSPIEHCLRTKWNDARITWKGGEPVL